MLSSRFTRQARFTRQTALPFFAALPFIAVLFSASSASALVAQAECAADADCGAGFTCEKGVSSLPCDPGAEGGCDSEPVVEEFGYCVEAPVTCDSDADCDEYLSCLSTDTGACWASSDGSSGCEEPDPNAPKTCTSGAPASCEADSDCPREFECVLEETYCLTIDCPEDAPDCGSCEPSTNKVCQPKYVSCESDSECPTDWSCSGGYTETCAGGGEVEPVDDPGSADDGSADAAPPLEEDPITCTPETVPGQCYPTVWNYDYIATSGEADSGGEVTADSKGAEDEDSEEQGNSGTSSDSGGCSVSPGGKSTGASWMLSLLLLAPLVRRRKTAV